MPTSSKIATVDLGGGRHAQVMLVGGAQTGTGSNVAASATSVTLLSANTGAVGRTIYNDSASACYVKMGTTASATDFAVKMSPGGYFEVPYGYQGRIDAIWDTATGNARIVEYT